MKTIKILVSTLLISFFFQVSLALPLKPLYISPTNKSQTHRSFRASYLVVLNSEATKPICAVDVGQDGKLLPSFIKPFKSLKNPQYTKQTRIQKAQSERWPFKIPPCGQNQEMLLAHKVKQTIQMQSPRLTGFDVNPVLSLLNQRQTWACGSYYVLSAKLLRQKPSKPSFGLLGDIYSSYFSDVNVPAFVTFCGSQQAKIVYMGTEIEELKYAPKILPEESVSDHPPGFVGKEEPPLVAPVEKKPDFLEEAHPPGLVAKKRVPALEPSDRSFTEPVRARLVPPPPAPSKENHPPGLVATKKVPDFKSSE